MGALYYNVSVIRILLFHHSVSLVVCLPNIFSCSGVPEESPSGRGGGGGVLPVLWSGSCGHSPGDPGPGEH